MTDIYRAARQIDRAYAILERSRQVTDTEADALTAAWDARSEYLAEVWDNAFYAAQEASAWSPWSAGRGDVWADARDALPIVRAAVLATLTRDLISDYGYRILAGPWLSVLGTWSDVTTLYPTN